MAMLPVGRRRRDRVPRPRTRAPAASAGAAPRLWRRPAPLPRCRAGPPAADPASARPRGRLSPHPRRPAPLLPAPLPAPLHSPPGPLASSRPDRVSPDARTVAVHEAARKREPDRDARRLSQGTRNVQPARPIPKAASATGAPHGTTTRKCAAGADRARRKSSARTVRGKSNGASTTRASVPASGPSRASSCGRAGRVPASCPRLSCSKAKTYGSTGTSKRSMHATSAASTASVTEPARSATRGTSRATSWTSPSSA